MTDIWMGAGPVPEILHRMLNLLAKARGRFRLPAFTPLSGLFHAVLNRMRFGEHRGGMFVRATGRSDGRARVRSWHLVAEGDDGPLIPSMAVEALLRKRLAGERPPAGARTAVRALALSDYEALFRHRTITMGFRDEDGETAGPIYRRVLGSAFDALPARVRALHEGSGIRRWSGLAEVRRGTGTAARLIAAAVGFPPSAEAVPVTVTFTPVEGGERWTRNFGGKVFTSRQWAGTGRDRYLVIERFGMVRIALALVQDRDRLLLVPRRWWFLRLPLPRALMPSGPTFETETDGRYRFDVTVRAPLVGLIVAYRGTLEPEA